MGPLGIKIADFITKRAGISTVAAVDKNERLVGMTLASLQEGLPADITVSASLREAVSQTRPDVAILTTVSDMERITPQILDIVALGIPVVSTCEELSYPWNTSPKLAETIDRSARENNVAVVGTGINPGFLMDALPAFFTALCQNVDRVEVNRYQNAVYRRVPFQKKIGAGLTLAEFEHKKRQGALRHVGLTESIHFIAAKLNWKLDKTEDIIMPVIAREDIVTEAMTIPKGNAAGVNQVGKGYVNGEAKIILNFRAAIGEADSFDEVKIIGTPNIYSHIEGGVNGDIGTCAITINVSRQILSAKPGLRTMGDIPSPACFAG